MTEAKVRLIQPQAKERRQPPEAGKGKKQFSLRISRNKSTLLTPGF